MRTAALEQTPPDGWTDKEERRMGSAGITRPAVLLIVLGVLVVVFLFLRM